MQGFTLIEMITVMVISSIIASVVWRAISPQIEGVEDTTRRAKLVDITETALSRMTRELRLALPNSIRVNAGGTAIEFLRILTGGRYRAQPDATNNDVCAGPDTDSINLASSSDCFEALGGLQNVTQIVAGAGGRAGCLASNIDCLVIYNSGQTGADAYAGDNVAGIAAATSTANGVAIKFDRSDTGTVLPRGSPTQRFYIADTPVSFVCDLTAQSINRYANYRIAVTQAVPPAAAAQALATQVTACSFTYTPGTATRAGLVGVQLTVSGRDVSSGAMESITLLDQVNVSNAP